MVDRIRISFNVLLGELPPFRKYGVKKVKDLTYNTKGNINTITFTTKIEARSLHVRSKNYLGVLEVEVYRGSLLGKVSLKLKGTKNHWRESLLVKSNHHS